MNEIQRYDFSGSGGENFGQEPDGQFVLYDDYKRIKKALEKSEAEAAADTKAQVLQEQVHLLKERITDLETNIQGLRNELDGDAQIIDALKKELVQAQYEDFHESLEQPSPLKIVPSKASDRTGEE